MVRDSFLKCQRYGGTYLGGLTEDIWILSPPGPKRGWEQPRQRTGGKRPQRLQTPLPSQAARLLSPPRSSENKAQGSRVSHGSWAHPPQRQQDSQFSRVRRWRQGLHLNAQTSRPLGLWRPGSPTRALRTHKGRSLGLAGLWHPSKHSTSVWKVRPPQTCGLAFALKLLLYRPQASPCSGYLCLWF